MDFGVAPWLLFVIAQEGPITLTPRDGVVGVVVGAVVVIATVVLIPFWEKWQKFRQEDQAEKQKAAAEAKKVELDDRTITFGALKGLYDVQTKNLAEAVAYARQLTDELVVQKLKVRDLEHDVKDLTEDLQEARAALAKNNHSPGG